MNEFEPRVYTVASRERVGNEVRTEVIRGGEIVMVITKIAELVQSDFEKPEDTNG